MSRQQKSSVDNLIWKMILGLFAIIVLFFLFMSIITSVTNYSDELSTIPNEFTSVTNTTATVLNNNTANFSVLNDITGTGSYYGESLEIWFNSTNATDQWVIIYFNGGLLENLTIDSATATTETYTVTCASTNTLQLNRSLAEDSSIKFLNDTLTCATDTTNYNWVMIITVVCLFVGLIIIVIVKSGIYHMLF